MLSLFKRGLNFKNVLAQVNRSFFCSKINKDNFAFGDSAPYVEEMYAQWKKNRKSVDSSWDKYFTEMDQTSTSGGISEMSAGDKTRMERMEIMPEMRRVSKKSEEEIEETFKIIKQAKPVTKLISEDDSINLSSLMKAYRESGHFIADLDPLGLNLLDSPKSNHEGVHEAISRLDYTHYGYKDADLDREFLLTTPFTGFQQKPVKLRDIMQHMNKAYCGTIGVEFSHILSKDVNDFLRDKFENQWASHQASNEDKAKIFDALASAVLFEEFFHKKFTTLTRFGAEGLESMISGLRGFIEASANQGVKDITFGMPHRGKLNVLANVMGKPVSKIIQELQGKHPSDENENLNIESIQSGDVSFHMGIIKEKKLESGKTVSLEMLPNPSHLETVDPIVMGKTRAKQHFSNDEERDHHVAVLIHGDTSFTGQGVVYESIQMENLANFTIGGTVHVIANNQLGFTTTGKEGRSTPYVTDIFKAFETPILHVNAEDPIAVDFAFKVASEFRMQFKKDIVIDLIGYRRFGHQEMDQPLYSQPEMYRAIANKPIVLQTYMDRLIEEGAMTKEDCEERVRRIWSGYEEAYKESESKKAEDPLDWVSVQRQYLDRRQHSIKKTGIPLNKIRELNDKINVMPVGHTLHSSIYRIYEKRHKSLAEGNNIDMATAEALSWASLLDEGYTVRLSGEDSERGTFSQRHAVLHDQEEDKKYIPLKTVASYPNNFQPCNSHLSEYGVLGYELGFSYCNPNALVVWEAQYGDFINSAQVIVDQYIASGERKWNTKSGLVLCLPHGMDGEGPDHSTARLERFLQMLDDEINELDDVEEHENDKNTLIYQCNYQVCYPTTSANYFHLMRRQLKRDFRKPLIIATSKKLLRYKYANSSIDEFTEDKSFIKVRRESNQNVLENCKGVKNVLVCSGQIYYNLILQREDLKRNDIAIISIEQIGPFPYKDFLEAIKPFPNAALTWVQEEHKNQGAWEYVKSRIDNLLKISGRKAELRYAGRGVHSVPSTCYTAVFEMEHNKLLEDAFKL